MAPRRHAAAGILGLITIIAFWSATVATKLLGSPAQIAQLKSLILWGMAVLIPAMATAGASGAALGKKHKGPLITRKSRRMKIIAANGLLILLPSAVFLAMRAASGQFDAIFYGVQTIELIAGATNITLLAANLRDGLAMAARRRPSPS
ncbi:MAG: hypothetical protein ACI8R4_004288 [Paracoccaceae bacterium]|jgi:hypothetical protein